MCAHRFAQLCARRTRSRASDRGGTLLNTNTLRRCTELFPSWCFCVRVCWLLEASCFSVLHYFIISLSIFFILFRFSLPNLLHWSLHTLPFAASAFILQFLFPSQSCYLVHRVIFSCCWTVLAEIAEIH